jgi:hypothetical protein
MHFFVVEIVPKNHGGRCTISPKTQQSSSHLGCMRCMSTAINRKYGINCIQAGRVAVSKKKICQFGAARSFQV